MRPTAGLTLACHLVLWQVRAARAWRRRFLVLSAVLAVVLEARAGGGPQNLLLVVNPRSWSSLTVANHYIQLRQIPPSHVLYLEWQGSPVGATADEFRQQILAPVLKAIESRGLAGQIDCVAYSSDFPFRIDATADFGNTKAPIGFAPNGTLTSFTYLWQLVQARQASPTLMEANHYFSRQANPSTPPPSRAFRLATGWDAQGQPADSGRHYLLSTMLAVTSGRGTSVSDAITYLTRSVKADGALPKGTIYYCRTSDVRTQVRLPLFAPAIRALQELGVNAEIVDAPLPVNKNDVQGLTLGAAQFDWKKSRSVLLSGAICDNLTSTSAYLLDNGGQTAMTEFLAAGAAGVSGTVAEPGAIVNKFPTPFIHVHYARGNSLAEAFYQSVHGPYQLLIVGDALCQPWANAPRVELAGVEANATVSGSLSLTPTAQSPTGTALKSFELLVDGRRVATTEPGGSFALDTTGIVDGYHELTAVAIEDTPIEVQGRSSKPIRVANGDCAVTLAVSQPQVVYGQGVSLRVAASGTGASQVMIFQNSRGVARGSATGDVPIDSRILGMGPARLQAVAMNSEGKPLAVSDPLTVQVDPPRPLRGSDAPATTELFPGLELALANGRKVAARDTFAFDWMEKLGVGKDEGFQMSGYVSVPKQDVYQFVFAFGGDLEISIDGRSIFRGSSDRGLNVWRYVPVALAAGSHYVQIKGMAKGAPRLQVRFGGPGAWLIGDRQFRHAS